MIIYTTLSHTKAYLPYQLEQLRKCFPDAHVVVVQDDTVRSGGSVYLSNKERDEWGIADLLSAPHAHDFGFGRGLRIARWILRQCPERYCCIVHGDMFPMAPMDLAELLKGRMLACRAHHHEDNGTRIWPGSNWLVWDKSQVADYEGTSYPIEAISEYSWTDDPTAIAAKIGVLPPQRMEWNEPAWLHFDRMAQWGIRQRDAEKIDVLHHLFGSHHPPDPADEELWTARESGRPIPIKADPVVAGAAARLGVMLADVGRYAQALRWWAASGFPVRSRLEVDRIDRDFCRRCEDYLKGRCKECGCQVNARGFAVVNKIKMATEHCPKEKW